MADNTIHVLGEGGGVFELDLPLHETMADKLAKGTIRRVQPDGTPYDEHQRPEGVPTLPDARPSVNAAKADWVGWAVKNGASVDDAEAATKADLIELYGVKSEPGDPDAEQAAKLAKEAAEKAALGENVDESHSHLEGTPGEVTHNENREDGLTADEAAEKLSQK